MTRIRVCVIALAVVVMSALAWVEDSAPFFLRDIEEREVADTLTWESSFKDASDAATRAKKPVLLYFTAGWCASCRRLERTTFLDPGVRDTLDRFVTVKVDIDRHEHQDLTSRYLKSRAIPTFVIIGSEGRAERSFTGYQAPTEFQTNLLEALKLLASRTGETTDHLKAIALFYLRSDDLDRYQQTVAEIERLNPRDAPDALEEVRLEECLYFKNRGRWKQAISSADRYLKSYRNSERAERVHLTRALCQFELDGTAEPVLRQRIRVLLAVLRERGPKNKDERTEWTQRINEALSGLAELGKAAEEDLLIGVRNEPPEVARRCAAALGGMKATSVGPKLTALLANPRTPISVRRHVAWSMEVTGDQAYLDVLTRHLGNEQLDITLRASCAKALRRIVMVAGGVHDTALAEVVLKSAEHEHLPLREACLSALLYLPVPYDLNRLFPLMGDRRTGWQGITIGQQAFGLFLWRIGKSLRTSDGTVASWSPAAVNHLRTWYAEHRATLVWNWKRQAFVEPAD